MILNRFFCIFAMSSIRTLFLVKNQSDFKNF